MVGNRLIDGQDTGAILERFGNKTTTARRHYRQLVSEGIKTGRRDDLVGDGLKRSQGECSNNEYESFGDRILDGGDFVDSLKLEVKLRDKTKSVISLVSV